MTFGHQRKSGKTLFIPRTNACIGQNHLFYNTNPKWLVTLCAASGAEREVSPSGTDCSQGRRRTAPDKADIVRRRHSEFRCPISDEAFPDACGICQPIAPLATSARPALHGTCHQYPPVPVLRMQDRCAEQAALRNRLYGTKGSRPKPRGNLSDLNRIQSKHSVRCPLGLRVVPA